MARAADGGYQGAAFSFRPGLHGPDGGTRTAHSERVRALRPACLAVQGQPARDVRAHQSGSELQGLRLRPARGADQDDAWALVKRGDVHRLGSLTTTQWH